MRKTKKQLALILSTALAISSIGLVGCQDANTEPANESQVSANESVAESADAAPSVAEASASADASGNAGGPGGPGGPGGGAGSAGQEFGTFEEVSSYAGVQVVGSEVTKASDWSGSIDGEVTADGMSNATIEVNEGNAISISKDAETDTFKIDHSTIKVSSGSINNDLGYEAAAGVGIGVETGNLWIENSSISSEGPRSTPVYLFSTNSPEATSLVVVDSDLTAHSDEIWMPPFKLLMGGARATLLMTRNNSWFYGSNVTSNNWGAISQDSVDAYTYVINTNAYSTDGGYATYLTYGMRLYGSQFAAGQYGIFMCGESDILTDTGAAALTDADAMSQVPDYPVDEDAVSAVVAPYNAVVVHNSLPSLDMVAHGNFKNTLLSTKAEDLPGDVKAISYDDDFFMPGVDILGSGKGCGASYFFNKNLYGSLALVRSMNADFTFDNTTTRSSNNVLLQSVITYDPPQACGYLSVGEGENMPGIKASFLNGEYVGDILHEDYQRCMSVTVSDNATLQGKVVSGTWAYWNDLWSEENLVKALESDGYTADYFQNENWVEDVHTNLIRSDDEAYADVDNLGVDLTLAKGGSWIVTENSSLSSLTIEDGASISAAPGKTITVYENCDASNSKLFYDETSGTKLDDLAAGSYSNVVIIVE